MNLTTRRAMRQAILSSIPEEPSQFDAVAPQYVYVPAAHRRALDPDAMLVEGIRGSGKSFWWHALQSEELRGRLFAQRQQDTQTLKVSAGFGLGSNAAWPDKDELIYLLANTVKPRLIWKTVVLRQITKGVVPDGQWFKAVKWVESNPAQVADAMRLADAQLRSSGQRHLVVFDALDRTADLRSDRQRLLRGLLELVLDMRAFGAIRAKVFVRPDMLDDPEVKAFPDASKVIASRVSLSWSRLDLYGLLFTYLGNGDNTQAALQFLKQTKILWRKGAAAELPTELRNDSAWQESVFVMLAGPYMGTDKRRGKTYTWVPNHLADADGQVSPRSFLAAIRRAAEVAEAGEVPSQAHPLHWNGLQEGVRKASEYRVTEVNEDLPWAHEAMAMLSDVVVPCESVKLLTAWRRGKLVPPMAQEGHRAPTESDRMDTLKQLARVGILAELPDGRVNIPDVYRVGFGMRRYGGFAPNT